MIQGGTQICKIVIHKFGQVKTNDELYVHTIVVRMHGQVVIIFLFMNQTSGMN